MRIHPWIGNETMLRSGLTVALVNLRSGTTFYMSGKRIAPVFRSHFDALAYAKSYGWAIQ